MSGFFWIASYPKSGNTWMRLALWCLKNGGRDIDFSAPFTFAPLASSRTFFDRTLGVDSSDLSMAETIALRPRAYEVGAAEAGEPLFRKVHDAWSDTPAGDPLFPPAITLGVIHIVRDPRDVAISWARHNGWTIDRAIAFMATPEAPVLKAEQLAQNLTGWSRHVESWLDAPGRQPPLLIRYEEMLGDMAGTLKRISHYVDWPDDPSLVERAVEATRFETLRDEEERHGFREKPPAARQFFLQGRAGAWRETLTQAQARRIEADHGLVMARLGYR